MNIKKYISNKLYHDQLDSYVDHCTKITDDITKVIKNNNIHLIVSFLILIGSIVVTTFNPLGFVFIFISLGMIFHYMSVMVLLYLVAKQMDQAPHNEYGPYISKIAMFGKLSNLISSTINLCVIFFLFYTTPILLLLTPIIIIWFYKSVIIDDSQLYGYLSDAFEFYETKIDD